MKHNHKSKIGKRPSLKSIKHDFTSENLTPFGGMAILRKELDKLGLRDTINNHFDAFNFRKEHQLGDLFEQILVTMVAGGTCIHDTKLLNDEYLQELFGWERIPDDGTYSKRFSEMNKNDVQKLRRIFRENAKKELKDQNLFITIDPTVETVCGNQEGAAVGYNPSKQGRKSYFPFIAYEYVQGQVMDAMLRPGNTSSSTDLVEFMSPLLKLRRRKGVTLRLDKGCTTNEVLTSIEEAGQFYVAKAKMYAPIWDAIANIKTWNALGSNRLVGQFMYKGRRHVVVEDLCNKKGEQLNLWGKKDSKISVIVTNRADSPEKIWRCYNKGAMVETTIKELKNDLSALDFRTQSYCANEIFLIIGAYAWNASRRIREKEELLEHKNCALKKLRWMLLMVPGYITRSSRYLKLILPKNIPFPEVTIPIFNQLRTT